MPVAPRSLNDLLNEAARRVGLRRAGLPRRLVRQPARSRPPPTCESVHRRHRDKEVLRDGAGPALRGAARGRPGDRRGDRRDQRLARPTIDALLERQNYRLAFWKTAVQELDYRRFFDINTLISLRMEDERVFEDSHRLILQWVREGVLDGLRVDHPDGLRDPAGYFRRLHKAAPDGWIVVEKILEPGEALPDDWPVAGTTGYDFLNRLGGLLRRPRRRGADHRLLRRLHRRAGRLRRRWSARRSIYVLKELFGSDVNRLVSLLSEVCERQKRYRDYTRRELTTMLREVIACFPVYRTYVQADEGQVGRPRRPVRRRGDRGRQGATGPRSTPNCSTSSATCSCSGSRARSSRRWSCGSSRTPAR